MDSRSPPGLDALRTRVANQAVSLAETVTDGFEGFHLGAGDWVVELMAPEGNSTRGGAQARQAIRLVPRRAGFVAVVVGTVDPVRSLAEIRTYEHVAILHELRFARPLEVTQPEYVDFLSKLDVVFNLARVTQLRVPPHPDLVAQHRSQLRGRPGKLSMTGLVIFVVVLLLAALVVYRVVRTRSFGQNEVRPSIMVG